FPGQICTVPDACAHVIVGVGVDQVRIVLSLSGEAARTCEVWTEHDYRPRGPPIDADGGRVVAGLFQGCLSSFPGRRWAAIALPQGLGDAPRGHSFRGARVR